MHKSASLKVLSFVENNLTIFSENDKNESSIETVFLENNQMISKKSEKSRKFFQKISKKLFKISIILIRSSLLKIRI